MKQYRKPRYKRRIYKRKQGGGKYILGQSGKKLSIAPGQGVSRFADFLRMFFKPGGDF